MRKQILQLALEQTDLSPRELAYRFTDEKRYFVSESSVYRLLKAHDLITSRAYVLMSASDSLPPKSATVLPQTLAGVRRGANAHNGAHQARLDHALY